MGLRSSLAQFIYCRNYDRIGLQPRGDTPSRLPREKVKTSVTQKEKSKGIGMEGYPEKYLTLINRAGGLYGRILTKVASTDRTQ